MSRSRIYVMTNSTLTKFDINSIITNLSDVELHNCLADYSVLRNLGDATATLLNDEALRRNLV